jgi:hypothetical protein
VNGPNADSRGAKEASDSKATVAANAPQPLAASEANAVDHSAQKVSNSRQSSKPIADSTLNIRIEHRFSTAELSLWVDDKLAYDRPLRGQNKKHWNPFRMDVQETETVRLPSGKHRIVVRVQSTPDNYEQSASLLGSFSKDRPETLHINFERQGEAMRLALR